jgi:hypothetical protein
MFDKVIAELVKHFDGEWDGEVLTFMHDPLGTGEPDEWMFDIKPVQIGDTLLVAIDGYVMLPEFAFLRTHIDRLCDGR